MKRASWIVLVVAASLTLFASLASLSNAYFGRQDRLGGVTLEELSAGHTEVSNAVHARRATAASYAAGFAVLLLAITLGPYRRGDRWAWWAILAGTLTETLLSLARVPMLGTWSGAVPALIQLGVVALGLALDAGRLRTAASVAALVLLAVSARAETASPQAAGLRLRDVPWTEAEPFLTAQRVVVLPLGAASKEHGPHLLLGNDEILADYLAERVVRARPVALLPTLTYGYYPAFLEYPGSVSLSLDTQRDVVVQICRSMAGYGPRRFYVLNTGLSTVAPLRESSERLAREGIVLRFTDIEGVGGEAERAVREEKVGTHADEIETSMILYMRPEAVRMDRARADGLVARSGPLTRDPASPTGHVTASGVFGDPTLATREKGEKVTEAKVAGILAEIDALAATTVPAGRPLSPLGDGRPR